MHRTARSALLMQLVATALAGCSNEADRPVAALLEALSDLGLHKASYDSATLTPDGFRVTKVRGTDDAGRPVAIDEIVAERASISGKDWRAANVIVNGLGAERLSARTLVLVDVSRKGAGPTAVGSYRATDVRGTLHGQPATARDVRGSMRADGGEIGFAALSASGDTWDGTVRVAGGPGTASISLKDIRSSRAGLDLMATMSGISPGELMTYVLAPEAAELPKGVLLQASVEANAPASPGIVTTPDPSGFRDPPMRALAEAYSEMAAKGVIGGGIRIAPPGGVPLSELGDAARAPDAWRRLGVSPLIERMPSDIVRKVLPLVPTQSNGGGRAQAAPETR